VSRYLALYGKPRYLGIVALPEDFAPAPDARVVVLSPRGEEIARLVGPLDERQEGTYRRIRTLTEQGEGPSRSEPAVSDLTYQGEASEEDARAATELREEEQQVLAFCRDLLRRHDLPMKIVDAEYLQDRRKLFLYFTAENRIDFRNYVRDLAREYKTRIELRQVGVRDESRIVKGLGPCGRPCCCGTWLNQFAPICIRMVKEQNLALNPTKISGICGRLMCCMGYEHENYRELWRGLPNPGSKLKTPRGNYLLMAMDLKERALRLRSPEGTELSVPVDRFEEFKTKVLAGEEWVVSDRERETRPRRSGGLASGEGGRPSSAFVPFRPAPERGTSSEAELEGERTIAPEGEPAAGEAAAKKKRRRRKKNRPVETLEGTPSPRMAGRDSEAGETEGGGRAGASAPRPGRTGGARPEEPGAERRGERPPRPEVSRPHSRPPRPDRGASTGERSAGRPQPPHSPGPQGEERPEGAPDKPGEGTEGAGRPRPSRRRRRRRPGGEGRGPESAAPNAPEGPGAA